MSTILADLSRIPAPQIVEQLDFEAVFAAMLTDLQTRYPEFTALLESDPAYKILQVCAYREVVVRQRANDACQAVMVAYARGSDLDQLAVNLGGPLVTRLLIDPGNPSAVPPIPPTYESDTAFRLRIVSAPEGFSVAGPRGAYVFHALSADGGVSDASAVSPIPGRVVVTILGRTGTGAPSSEILAAVTAALTSEDIRPLTDEVIVQGATIVEYTIAATLYIYPGPEYEPIIAAAQTAAAAYAEAQRRLGRDIRLSAIYAALHVEGVQRVELTSPSVDLVLGAHQASYCTGITVTFGGVDE